jgi:hypothetical protein
MLANTSTSHAPWQIVKGENREDSRIQAMKSVLSRFQYADKNNSICKPDPKKVVVFDNLV